MSSPNLTKMELMTLKAWEGTSEDFDFLPFSTVESRTGLARRTVKLIVRRLSRKGVTRFGRGLFDDDGCVAGSGYGLTNVGRKILNSEAEE
jgi:RIO-like serine/threonine protein kinase